MADKMVVLTVANLVVCLVEQKVGPTVVHLAERTALHLVGRCDGDATTTYVIWTLIWKLL